MDLLIREADFSDPQDSQTIIDLTNAYACDPNGQGRALPDDVLARLVPAMRAHGGIITFLAILDGEPVGLATCIKSFSSYFASPILNIHDLTVLGHARRQGIAKQLISAATEKALELGCSKLSLEVTETNPARELYTAVGFSGAATDASPKTFFCTMPLARP